MKSNLSDEEIKQLKEWFSEPCEYTDEGNPIFEIDFLQDRNLNALWNIAARRFNDFERSRSAFFILLIQVLSSGRARLARNGTLLSGSMEEQIAFLEEAWPATPLLADLIVFPVGSPNIGTGRGMDLWFFMDECPAEIIWGHK